MPRERFDLTGKKFGRLRVLRFDSYKIKPSGQRTPLWIVKCDCGSSEKPVSGNQLTQEKTRSCGCLRIEAGCKTLGVSPSGKPYIHVLGKYRWNAKKRNLKWALSESKFVELILSDCHYCGQQPSPYNGIDRKNSNVGYVEENVVPCCKVCNTIKGKVSYEVFISFLQRLTGARTIRAWLLQP